MTQAENFPVVIGVGQAMEPLPSDLTHASSYVDLATVAVGRALADTGAPAIVDSIDSVAAVRTFEDSLPGARRAFNGPWNFPGAVAQRIGAESRDCVYEKLGGQSPQGLVNEFAEQCSRGEGRVALLFGAEVIANVKAARRAGIELDWSETVHGDFTDRGGNEALELVGAEALRHGMLKPMQFYGLMETARRLELGIGRDDYAKRMGELFAPFSRIAAGNAYAQFPQAFSPAELIEPDKDNPMLVSPYTLNLVSKDSVNQAAAVLVTTAGRARELGVPRDRWIYLHGSADADELPLLERPGLGRSLAQKLALEAAMDDAGADAADIAHFDLYSCFPLPVFNSTETLGIGPDDPRPLTQTGGLPYFGGPGNNYSMHAIAAMIETLRADPGGLGLIHANGGFLSKHSVGVYGSESPSKPPASDKARLEDAVRRQASVRIDSAPEGIGMIDSWVVSYRGGQPDSVIVVGRLEASGARFMAANRPGDEAALRGFEDSDPVGRPVRVEPEIDGNRFRLTRN
ncbi:MAG: acetyl-CoA acetyltransferase [Xanthomonadales bacterium]|nr:acetyl-CoA acetyltransferase [Xanthomonadales bacterium]